MSPTGLMTFPILDLNTCGMKIFASFTLQCVKYSLMVGNSDVVTQVHCVMKSPAFSLLYCMASLVVMDDHRQVSTLQFAHPFNVTLNLSWVMQSQDPRRQFFFLKRPVAQSLQQVLCYLKGAANPLLTSFVFQTAKHL